VWRDWEVELVDERALDEVDAVGWNQTHEL